MESKTVPYLCGGTFLCQVLRARKPLKSATDYTNSNKESLAEQETFRRLISIYQLSDFYSCSSLKTYTSNFKSCKDTVTAFTQFNDSDLQLAFDSAVKTENSTALQLMSDFVDEFINVQDKGIQLVRCLLGIIKDDDSILPQDEFYIENGKSVTKKELANMNSFTIESFLLGVWHYIIMNRAAYNKRGADTYNSWYASRGNYCGKVGNDITRNIIVNSISVATPILETEEIKDEQDSFEERPKSEYTENVQHIEQATVVNQYGEKCVHIDHVDTLNL